jgi:hypothetical protein
MRFHSQQCVRYRMTISVLLLAMAACVRQQPLADLSKPPVATATTIVREASYPNVDLASQGRGRLEVVVRSTDRPTQLLGGAHVRLRIGPRDSLVRTTDDQGLAVFEAVLIGEHELLTRRLGYGQARAVVSVRPGCRTDAEAYIAISGIGIAPPPPMPGRIIQTTCR